MDDVVGEEGCKLLVVLEYDLLERGELDGWIHFLIYFLVDFLLWRTRLRAGWLDIV